MAPPEVPQSAAHGEGGSNPPPPVPASAGGWLDLVRQHGLATVLAVVLVGYLIWQSINATTALEGRLVNLLQLQDRTNHLLEQQVSLLTALLQRLP